MMNRLFWLCLMGVAFVGVSGLLSVTAADRAQSILFSENFDQIALGANQEETIAGKQVWTNRPPAGWINDVQRVPGFGDPATDGITEWAGWSFTDKAWWIQVAGDQGRSQFTRGHLAIAVMDSDEWSDAYIGRLTTCGFSPRQYRRSLSG
jgi:hypothetical protein